jgi:hypothetical protein
MSDIASPNSATKPSAARSNANGDDAATSAGAAQSGDAPWWRTIKVPRVSLHDVPVWGLKVSKVRDDATRRDATRDEFQLQFPRETRDARRETRTNERRERTTD